MIKKLAVLTSGGDAPGMNNAIRAIVRAARQYGIKPYLVFNGYKGLYEGQIESAEKYNVDNYINQGGTFIGAARFPEFKNENVRSKAKKNLEKLGIEALIVIGGDGSYQGAQCLHEMNVKTVTLPGTIDNDITSSDLTIGYPTALQTIVENIERVRDTMNSHHRIGIVEVMGHGCGDLALYSGLATGAEIIVTNEHPIEEVEIAKIAKNQFKKGKRSVIIIVSEKIFPDLNALEKKIQTLTKIEVRAMSFSHIQRGGNPTAIERINATRMGLKAVDLLKDGFSGLAVGIINSKTTSTPILEALIEKRENRTDKAQRYNLLNQS